MTLTDTNDRRIGIVLLLLAALVLAWVIYDLWQRGINLTQGAATRSPASTLSVPEPIRNPYSLGEIVNAHIFGEKRREVVAKPKVVEQKKVEKTRLRLRLLGLVSSSEDGMARALISAENGRLQSYGVGEQIENTDSSVHSIEEMRVLLDRDGRLESLEMARPKLDKKKADQNNRSSAGRTAGNQSQPQFNDNRDYAEQPVLNQEPDLEYPPDQLGPEQYPEQYDENFPGENERVPRMPDQMSLEPGVEPGIGMGPNDPDNFDYEQQLEPGMVEGDTVNQRTVAPKFPF